MTFLDPAIERVRQAKQAKADAEAELDAATELLAELMAEAHMKTVVFERDGKDFRCTVVQAERVKIDGPRLQSRIGKVAYRRLCKLVVDTKLVELALKRGDIDSDSVASCSEIVKNKASIRFSNAEDDE